MYSLDEEKLKCALGNRDIWLLAWHRKAKNVYYYFWRRDLRYVYICLWLLVHPNSNNWITHGLWLFMQPSIYVLETKKPGIDDFEMIFWL